MKLTLSLLALFLSVHVSAQDLKYIPDVNLRNALTEQGFTVNDSLHLGKVKRIVHLKLQQREIENLDGLQYFESVSRLIIFENKIKNLNYLPPNLEFLLCDDNEISIIDSLPNSLEYISFCNNKINYFPKLPENLEFINYAQNPIPFDNIPTDYQGLSCDNYGQNCLPYKFIKWNIFDANTKKISQKITRMRVSLESKTTGGIIGARKEAEILDFKIVGSKLVSGTSRLIKSKGIHRDTAYSDKKYIVQISELKKILNDIYNEKMSFKLPLKGNDVLIDLSNKKNGGALRWCSEEHPTRYKLHYIFYVGEDIHEITYNFESCLNNGLYLYQTYKTMGYMSIKTTLEWFYMYKLTNLILPNHELTEEFFSEEDLQYSIKHIE